VNRQLHGPHGVSCDLAAPEPAARQAAVALWRELLEPFAATGCRVAVLHPSAGRTPRADRAEAARRLADSLAELLPAAQQAGLLLALENLGPGQFGCREEELLAVLEACDSPALGLCFDTGHAHLTRRLLPLHDALAARCVHYHTRNDSSRTITRRSRTDHPMAGHSATVRPGARTMAAGGSADRPSAVSHLRSLATAMVHSCLAPDAFPRLSPPGRAEFVKSVTTGCFEIIRSQGSA